MEKHLQNKDAVPINHVLKGGIKATSAQRAKINALFVSAIPAIIAGFASLFSNDALISLDTKKYLNFSVAKNTEIFSYQVIIYDDKNTNKWQNFMLAETTIHDSDLIVIKKNKPKVILYTDSEQISYIRRVMKYKINGIVSKYAELEKIRNAIIKVANGERYYCERIIGMLYANIKYNEILTRCEREVLECLRDKLNYKEIASIRNRKPKTILRQIEDIKKKLGVFSLAELLERLADNNQD